jgi:hypothetical protein
MSSSVFDEISQYHASPGPHHANQGAMTWVGGGLKKRRDFHFPHVFLYCLHLVERIVAFKIKTSVLN